MAQDTFGQVWQRVLLYAPGTPVPLVQQAVKNAYNRALSMHSWSELLQDGEKVIATEYSTGTVAVTNGSTTVTGSGTTFTSAMTGRQIIFDDADGQPYYTVTYVSATSLTLDRAYGGADDSSTTYSIGEYYVEFPSDLSVLTNVRDLNNNWSITGQAHQQGYLDMVDAKRTSTGSPSIFVAAPPRVSSGVAYPRYEFWPRISAGTHIAYQYLKDAALTSNSTYLIVMLPSEAIVYGALADLCLWPGTGERPNPYFNMDLHKKYSDLFEATVHDGEMADLERSQRMILYDDAGINLPGDANFAQSHGLAPVN